MLARSGLATALLLAALLCDARALVAAEPKQRPDDSCRSAGALKFDADQRPMQRSRLEVCSKYRKNTCCDASHAHALRLKIREPVVAKFSQQCQRYTEEMVCSSCHPFMGTWEMRNVCPRMCNEWYSACKDEFYSYSGSGSLSPCYGNALICSPLSSIANNGAEFCTKMGFHVGSGDDREGDECFDGSVPKQLGMAEPTEPWQQVLKRIIEEEMENPSAWFIATVFVMIFTILVGYKSLKNLGDPFSAGQLSLDEVRRLQQERYARGELVYEEETDSSSSEEEGGLAQYIFQRVPRTAPATPSASGATPPSSGATLAAGDATPGATDSAPTATTDAEEPEVH